jgi:hypothetical protein
MLFDGSLLDAGVPIECLLRHHYFTFSLSRLVRHQHTSIMASPIPVSLVIEKSISAQL